MLPAQEGDWVNYRDYADLSAQVETLKADLAKATAGNLQAYTLANAFTDSAEPHYPRKSDRRLTYTLTLPSGRDIQFPEGTAPEVLVEVLTLIASYTAQANRPKEPEKKECLRLEDIGPLRTGPANY